MQALLLQRQAGNRAVETLVRNVQRIPITHTDLGETLFNQTNAHSATIPKGQAGAATYGGGDIKYEMERIAGPPPSVKVTVRMLFVAQSRTGPAAAADPTAIPAADPRRAFGENMCRAVAANWAGKLSLASTQHPVAPPPPPVPAGTDAGAPAAPAPAPAPVDVKLPVSFVATPMWDPTDATAHTTIRLFGDSTAANPFNGNPIDAGNYYMNLGTAYAGMSQEAIATHEYGHLIGLQDEYSQSNLQAHAIIHQMGGGAGQDSALDKETVRRMVMAALAPPFRARLNAVRPQLAAALAPGKTAVAAALTTAATTAASAPELVPITLVSLGPLSDLINPGAWAAVNAACTKAKATVGASAKAATHAQFSPPALADAATNAYMSAMAEDRTADFGGFKINILGSSAGKTGVFGAASRGPNAASAKGAAGATIGLPRGKSKIPPIQPSNSLLSELAALPAAWKAAGAEPGPALASELIQEHINNAIVAAGAAGAPAKVKKPAQLTALAAKLATNAVKSAVTNASAAFIEAECIRVATDSVAQLSAQVKSEVDRIMAEPAEALTPRVGIPPETAALAAAMKARLKAKVDATKAAQTAAGTTEINPGKTLPNQEITYSSSNNLMSDNKGSVRPDQFDQLINQFNTRKPELRHDDEDAFKAVTS